MSTPAFPVPAEVDRLQRTALVAGGAGVGLSLLGAVFDLGQFLRSWLFAELFWTGVAVGCLSLLMINHMTGGVWGLVIRRLLEAGGRTVPLLAILFLPIALGLPRIYEWARPEVVAADPVLQMKRPYLNVPFFLLRAVFFFAAWSALAHFLSRWSGELDRTGSLRVARRLRGLSGGGLLILGLTITFSAVDWAMSLDPHWFSTIYGIVFMVGQALSAMALVIVLLARLRGEEPFAEAVRPQVVHDLGKLMLAFVMLWAYVNFSQFLIIWSGNLPEEAPWYILRLHGGWQGIALLVLLFHFVLPFLLLLSRDLKRSAPTLARVAGALFLVRLVDLYWLVAPDLHHHGALRVSWTDVTAPVGVGGIWLFWLARELRVRPLLPQRDPDLEEFLAQPAEGHA
ncbi:MAG: hypothetical protein DMF80_08255 [Acidobacteria bacterium]|nr:MAG: hypothetical protein DMF80_08255 [Acidobacteriota bacterium]